VEIIDGVTRYGTYQALFEMSTSWFPSSALYTCISILPTVKIQDPPASRQINVRLGFWLSNQESVD